MKKNQKSSYASSAVILYTVCRFGWKLYLKNWQSFAAFSPLYTEEFGNAALKAVDTAEAMPDVSQRRGSITQQGNELDDSSKTGLLFWKKLRRYISKAVSAENRKAAILQAGGTHFAKASKGNYSQIAALLTSGQTYLEANLDLLTTKGQMPATFPDGFNKAKATYDNEHLQYGEAKGAATDGTTGKLTANNTLYLNLLEMCGDAQTVFEDQKATAKQFSYSAIKRLVTKDLSGIHFKVLIAGTKSVIPGALITTDESDKTYPVNELGVLALRMKVGAHSITVTAPGFATYSGVVMVSAGVMHRVHISLAKEEVATTAKVLNTL